MNEIASSWRAMRIMWRLGLVDIKWLGIAFLASALASWIIRELVLRRLERRNRLLRFLLNVQAANTELLRLGSKVQVEINEEMF